MKARLWSLAIVLILINYIIFALLFHRLMETDFSAGMATPTPLPTFTPAPAEPIIIVPTPEPVTPEPTPTATKVVDPAGESGLNGLSQSDNVQPAAQIDPAQANAPRLVAPGPVNIRSGPSLNYPVIGTLNANTAMPIVGRNPNGSWWQIKISAERQGWVSNEVVTVNNTQNVPVTEAPPPSTPVSNLAQPAGQ